MERTRCFPTALRGIQSKYNISERLHNDCIELHVVGRVSQSAQSLAALQVSQVRTTPNTNLYTKIIHKHKISLFSDQRITHLH